MLRHPALRGLACTSWLLGVVRAGVRCGFGVLWGVGGGGNGERIYAAVMVSVIKSVSRVVHEKNKLRTSREILYLGVLTGTFHCSILSITFHRHGAFLCGVFLPTKA